LLAEGHHVLLLLLLRPDARPAVGLHLLSAFARAALQSSFAPLPEARHPDRISRTPISEFLHGYLSLEHTDLMTEPTIEVLVILIVPIICVTIIIGSARVVNKLTGFISAPANMAAFPFISAPANVAAFFSGAIRRASSRSSMRAAAS
jgi:hypothetical protein